MSAGEEATGRPSGRERDRAAPTGGPGPQPIRVAICDDQALVRGGFRYILEGERDIEVVGEAEDGEQAVGLARSARPDLILMDIRMPNVDGIEATRRILPPPAAASVRGAVGGGRGERPAAPRVLILTTFDLNEYVYDALRAGASGFLLKDTPPEQLVAGVRTVAHGDALLGPTITRRLIKEFTEQRSAEHEAPDGLDELTPRELEVFGLVARGLANAEIATALIVSEATVKTHVAHLLAKLGLRDRVQAVVLAYESGIVEPGGR